MKIHFFLYTCTCLLNIVYVQVLSHRVKRIIGGIPTDITSVPYMLSLMLIDINQHICGASIINEQWAITAAHCVYYTRKDSSGKITMNEHEVGFRSGSSTIYEGGFIHRAIEIVQHEKYDRTNNDYDIAVCKVVPYFTYSTTTKPLDLPNKYKSLKIKYGLVSGWGYFRLVDELIYEELSKNLQSVVVSKLNRNKCIDLYQYTFQVTDRQMCYGLENNDKKHDTCKGDSGGPLVNKDNIIIGITSWGDRCGDSHSPGVYTNVGLFTNWIKNKTRRI